MHTPRAVFFDIDRTLYDHRSDYISPASLAAIAALRARGIIPAIATGRGYGTPSKSVSKATSSPATVSTTATATASSPHIPCQSPK